MPVEHDRFAAEVDDTPARRRSDIGHARVFLISTTTGFRPTPVARTVDADCNSIDADGLRGRRRIDSDRRRAVPISAVTRMPSCTATMWSPSHLRRPRAGACDIDGG